MCTTSGQAKSCCKRELRVHANLRTSLAMREPETLNSCGLWLYAVKFHLKNFTTFFLPVLFLVGARCDPNAGEILPAQCVDNRRTLHNSAVHVLAGEGQRNNLAVPQPLDNPVYNVTWQLFEIILRITLRW